MLRGGHRLRHPFLDISRPGRLRRRARACSRSPSRPTTRRAGASTSITPTTPATSASTNSSARSADPGGAGLAPHGDRDPPPGQRQPQRRPAAVPRRPPLLRHRRRRLRRRPAEQRPEQGRACSASCCGSTRGPRGGRPYSVPAANPFVGKPGRDEIYSYGLRNPFRFSFDTVTARQPRIAIGDVGQNRFEELDYTTVAAAARRQLRLGRLRGLRPLPGRKQRHARPRRHRQTDLRLPATAAAAAARSSAATSSRDRRLPLALRPLRLRRPLRGPAAQPRPPPAAGRAATTSSASPSPARPPSAKTTAAPPLRRLARRARLPPGPR